MLALLAAAPAMALDLSIEASVLGSAESWSLQDIEYGVQEPLLITVDKKRAYRLDVVLSEHDAGVACSITVVSMKTSWRGKTTETVLSRPSLITMLGQEASIKQALRPETTFLEVTLIAQD